MGVSKIALICNSLQGGGAETVMSSLAKLFSQRGKQIDFLVAKAEGIHLEKVKKHSNLIDLNSKTRYIVPKLYKYLHEEKPDILLSTQTHINVAAIISAKLNKTKVVVREATTPSLSYIGKKKYLGYLVKNAYKRADKIISVSDGVKQDLIKNFSIKNNLIQTVLNPIISDEFYLKSEETIEHPWYNLGLPIIVAMGRFAKAKDYPTLINAFSLINNECKSKLIILGDTNSDTEVKKKVLSLIAKYQLEDSIDLIGYKPNPFPYLKNASLFILSSTREGLPGALIQAVALNCPVISTDCESGPREILKGGKYGTLVKVGDFKSIALHAIKILRSNPIVKNLDQSFIKTYSDDGICDSYINLFESI